MAELTFKPIPLPAEYVKNEAHPRINLGLRPTLLLLLFAGLVGVFMLSLAVGSVEIPLEQIITVLRGGEADRTALREAVC